MVRQLLARYYGTCTVCSTGVVRVHVLYMSLRYYSAVGSDGGAASAKNRGEANAPPGTLRTGGLHRTQWLRMDPVMKWTLLVDLGRRGRYAIQPPVCSRSSDSSSSAKVLGAGDSQVRFTPASTAQHASFAQHLPYAARLQVCLSLLMWIQCLRDVQDTIARVRLPFAPTHRRLHAAIASVFPTRRCEYWVEPNTTVEVQLDTERNSTAEQIAAPHTWDVETAETIEDSETETTISLGGGVRHGARDARESAREQLRRVQGRSVRPSDDDELAQKRLGARNSVGGVLGSWSGRRRRRLAGGAFITNSTKKGNGSSSGSDGEGSGPSSSSASYMSNRPDLSDVGSLMPSPEFADDDDADRHYHGNDNRAEGCPLNEEGRSTSMPIYIAVPSVGRGAMISSTELLMRACVMAHAAIFSSLFIEGRVVHFTSDNLHVTQYVEWLFEEFLVDKHITVEHVSNNAPHNSEVSLMPYYPSWCMRTVVVLLPPKSTTFRRLELRDVVVAILQAAPCSVMVGAGPHVEQVMAEVQRVAEQQSSAIVAWVPVAPARSSSAHTTSTPEDDKRGLLKAISEALVSFYSAEVVCAPGNCIFTRRQLQRWVWTDLPRNVRLVGINAQPLDVLYFYPHASFLTHKVGNAFRYRAVCRTVVARSSSGWSGDTGRRLWGRYWLRWRPLDRVGLHSSLAAADKRRIRQQQQLPSRDKKVTEVWRNEKAIDALRAERTVEYLANPSKWTLLGLLSAKLFHV